MRKLILKMSVSIDGFACGPNGEIDWIFKSMDETAAAWTVARLSRAGVHIMGSRTFRDMASYWPTSTEPYAEPMNEIPKVVFSRTGLASASSTRAVEDARRAAGGTRAAPASAASWAEARVASGDLAGEIARLKREPGKDILAHGGAGFARSLVKLGVIDEYALLVHPVVLGSGLALFSDLPAPLDLKLESALAFPGGAVAHIYRP